MLMKAVMTNTGTKADGVTGGAALWEMHQLSAALETAGTVRRARIASIRRQIAAGTYHVSAEALAEKLITAKVVQ